MADVVKQLARFKGDFVLQTMFLRGSGWETAQWMSGWMEIVRELKPREIMVYTIDRETPMKGLGKYNVKEMRNLVQPLLDEGFQIQIKG